MTEEAGALVALDVSGAPGQHGRDGVDGRDGRSSGDNGSDGQHAGPAQAGQAAGEIRLTLRRSDTAIQLGGELRLPDGTRQAIQDVVALSKVRAHREIELWARGGNGGHGGKGGRGGGGARGRSGSDATRYSDGGDGGSGGDGGDGGDGSSGAAGGDGGTVSVALAEADTALLMLLAHDTSGGSGGRAGENGIAGMGGPGGSGGSSYSWSETESYTDSSGNRQTRSVSHRNSGGRDGRSGRDGRWGSAALRDGEPGAVGHFEIRVQGEAGTASYASRYHLRLLDFRHTGSHPDGIYEPGEVVRVSDVVVENVGGMPLPSGDEVAVELLLGDWVRPEAGKLLCAPGLPAGQRQKLDGELLFHLREHVPEEPGPALAVREEIGHRAFVPAVRREFSGFQDEAAREAGRIVISFPAHILSVESLRALASGEATRVVIKVHNDSSMALGAKSETQRVLRVRVFTAPGSELGDEAVVLRPVASPGGAGAGAGEAGPASAAGPDLAPSEGFSFEIDELAAGASAEVTVTLAIRDGAPAYRSFTGRVALELGIWDAPSEPRCIQLARFDVRVARRFEPLGADVLLVVNHKTGRAAVEAWEALAGRLSAKIAVWDLSREGHFDLERSLGGDLSLAQHFAGKAMVILNNELDGPLGPTRAHAWLRSDQVTRAAQGGLDVAFVGQGANLRHLLLAGEGERPAAALPAGAASEADELALAPLGEGASMALRDSAESAESTALAAPAESAPESPAALIDAMRSGVHAAAVTCHRRYLVRFWSRPSSQWLEKQAKRVSRALHRALPARRHVVVYRFAPEQVSSSWWWGTRWKVGTLEAVQVLDRVGNAVVQVAIDDADLGEGSYVRTAATTAAVLAMFDFDEQLTRLRQALRQASEPREGSAAGLVGAAGAPSAPDSADSADSADALLAAIVDAIVSDTTEELVAALASEAGEAAVPAALPRLAALSLGMVQVPLQSSAGEALVRLLGRVLFVARSQRAWWHHLPPFRWMSRAPRLAARVSAHVEELAAKAFGPDAQSAARGLAAIEEAVAALRRQHKAARELGQAGKRKGWALELGRAPLLLPEVTGDSELLTRPEERVLSGDERDALFADEAAAIGLRQKLEEAAASEKARLFVS